MSKRFKLSLAAAALCAAGFANPAVAGFEPASRLPRLAAGGEISIGQGSGLISGGDLEFVFPPVVLPLNPPVFDPVVTEITGPYTLPSGRVVILRGSSDLALWNIVESVLAQQKGRVFDLVESNATNVSQLEGEVSPVPLPGVTWLFVMGVLGIAGSRVTGMGGARRRDDGFTGVPAAA